MPVRRNVAFISVLLALSLIFASLYLASKWGVALPSIPPIEEHPTVTTDHHLNPCPKRLDWLNDLSITYPVKYARRNIIVSPNAETARVSVTKIDAPLLPESQVIDLTSSSEVDLEHCMEPLLLGVPNSPLDPPHASHIVFGMATLIDRLELTIPFLQRWLAHTNARLLVIAEGPDDSAPDPIKMAELESKMRDLGLRVTIVKPLSEHDGMPERYFSLVKLMYSHRESDTKWMGIIDDDTFFPSVHSLVEKLGTFDAEKQWYIGAMSEEWWPVARYGLMAFGGAGIFLSVPLAAVLDANYGDCMRRSGAGAGDMRIRECIVWHADTKLTHVPGLHQIDMHGDISGLYESGRLPLSLHHWKGGWWDEQGYGTWFPMHAMHLVADICGDCFLQRWQFGSEMVLSNGYSIATYPTGAWDSLEKAGHLGRPESTWEAAGIVEGSNNAGWDHYVGPLRPKLQLEEEKVQYRFLDAVAVDGGVRQFYLHLGIDGDLDTLFEIFWTRSTNPSSSLGGNETVH